MAFSDNLYNLASMDTNADSIAGRIQIKKAMWGGVTTAGHDLVLTDADGSDLGTIKAGANDNVTLSHLEGMWVTDFTVTTIDSGTLYVQYK